MLQTFVCIPVLELVVLTISDTCIRAPLKNCLLGKFTTNIALPRDPPCYRLHAVTARAAPSLDSG